MLEVLRRVKWFLTGYLAVSPIMGNTRRLVWILADWLIVGKIGFPYGKPNFQHGCLLAEQWLMEGFVSSGQTGEVSDSLR